MSFCSCVELARIRHAIEEEAMRGGRWRYVTIVGRGQQLGDVGQWPARTGDVEHRSDEESHHVMQKSVGFDLEHEPARAIAPSCLGDTTAMIIMCGCRATHGEAKKAVVTLDVSGRCLQGAPIQGLPEYQLV